MCTSANTLPLAAPRRLLNGPMHRFLGSGSPNIRANAQVAAQMAACSHDGRGQQPNWPLSRGCSSMQPRRPQTAAQLAAIRGCSSGSPKGRRQQPNGPQSMGRTAQYPSCSPMGRSQGGAPGCSQAGRCVPQQQHRPSDLVGIIIGLGQAAVAVALIECIRETAASALRRAARAF